MTAKLLSKALLKSPMLRRGDLVRLVSPASAMAAKVPHRRNAGIAMLEKLGFRVQVGRYALYDGDYTAGTPWQRAKDLNEAFADKQVKGIISFIGGNHSNQLLNLLDYNLIRQNPKVFLGYSDMTVLHLALHTKVKLVTFYGPAVLTQFAENPVMHPYSQDYLSRAVMSRQPVGKIEPSIKWTDEVLSWFTKEDQKRPRRMAANNGWRWLKTGKAVGPLIGGCIASIMHLRGTSFWPDFSGSILFWEISESEEDFTKGDRLSNIDAYLADLELSGVFSRINGMIIGRPFGYSVGERTALEKLVKNRLASYAFPILANVDIGHTDPMITVPIGVQGKLDSSRNQFIIMESGVR